MRKANIIRAIVWGFVFLIVLALAIYGFILNYQNFKNYEENLGRIVNIFNTNSNIINYEMVNTHIEAKLKGKKIIVTSSGTINEKYTFKFKNHYLETNIDTLDSFGRMIVMIVSDSVAVNKGGFEGDIYPLFSNDEILNYKLEDGISFETKGNNYKIKINLDDYILKPFEDTEDTPSEEETPNEEENEDNESEENNQDIENNVENETN